MKPASDADRMNMSGSRRILVLDLADSPAPRFASLFIKLLLLWPMLVTMLRLDDQHRTLLRLTCPDSRSVFRSHSNRDRTSQDLADVGRNHGRATLRLENNGCNAVEILRVTLTISAHRKLGCWPLLLSESELRDIPPSDQGIRFRCEANRLVRRRPIAEDSHSDATR